MASPPKIAGRYVTLGTVLERIHNALACVVTLQAEYRDWSRVAPSLSLVAEPKRKDDCVGGLRWQGSGPFPQTVTSTRRIWLSAPDRLRVEIERNGQVEKLGVRDGSRWWRWTRAAGADSGDLLVSHRRGLPPLLDPPLLTPARLVGWLRFDDVGTGWRAGRDVVTAHAVPRDRSPAAPGNLRCDLEFDVEHGVLLRMSICDGADCVRLTEATDVAYGRELDPALFICPPAHVADVPRPNLDDRRQPTRTRAG